MFKCMVYCSFYSTQSKQGLLFIIYADTPPPTPHPHSCYMDQAREHENTAEKPQRGEGVHCALLDI